MGKGDLKTRRGKIFNGSYGTLRPRRGRKRYSMKKDKSPKRIELIIIESLSSEFKKTGTFLNDEIIKYKKIEEPNLSSSLIEVTSKVDFIAAIRNILNRIPKERLYPFLHIEAHGSDDGIHLESGEIVSWEELFNEIRPINILLKNSLILNLALCYGISIIAKINPFEPAPFRAVIGTMDEIFERRLLKAFEIFYGKFFFSFSGVDAVNEVNKEMEEDKVKFFYLKSEDLFDLLTKKDRDPIFIKRLISDFAVKEKATNPSMKDIDFKEVLVLVEENIDKIFIDAINHKSEFLMSDIKGIFQ